MMNAITEEDLNKIPDKLREASKLLAESAETLEFMIQVTNEQDQELSQLHDKFFRLNQVIRAPMTPYETGIVEKSEETETTSESIRRQHKLRLDKGGY